MLADIRAVEHWNTFDVLAGVVVVVVVVVLVAYAMVRVVHRR
ncbi:MAG: hypothetical protein V1757_07935 [Actinomycetota bacterium]